MADLKDAQQLFHEGLAALNRAALHGIRVDTNYCKKIDKSLEYKLNVLDEKLRSSRLGRIWKNTFKTPNWKSGPQLQTILFQRLKLKSVKTTDKGGDSIDNEVLEILKEKVPDLKYLINYNQFEKVKNTYINNLLKESIDGIMHPVPNLHTARTFRSSYSDPNL